MQEQWAPRVAGAASLQALQSLVSQLGIEPTALVGVVADLGPGSFTGVRVGVTLAKTLGYAWGLQVAGAPAYELVAEGGTVVLPSKRGELFVFEPGQEPVVRNTLPDTEYSGYGHGVPDPVYPHASRFGRLVGRLQWLPPEKLVPQYIHAPSISVPKNPYGSHVRAHEG